MASVGLQRHRKKKKNRSCTADTSRNCLSYTERTKRATVSFAYFQVSNDKIRIFHVANVVVGNLVG